jgi:hypothetical protein
MGGGRQWWLPNISSLSRGRGQLGAGPVRMLFEHVAGPAGGGRAPGVFWCGLRAVSWTVGHGRAGQPEERRVLRRPSNQCRDGAFRQARWVAVVESGTGSLVGAAIGRYTDAERPRGDHAGDAGAVRPLPGHQRLTGIATHAGRIPRTRSASGTPWPPRPPLWRLSLREQADLAFATFLAKILMPAFSSHRPGRASPRKTKKAGGFPPAESSSACSAPGRSPESNAIGT